MEFFEVSLAIDRSGNMHILRGDGKELADVLKVEVMGEFGKPNKVRITLEGIDIESETKRDMPDVT